MNKPDSKKRLELTRRRDAPLATRTDLSQAAVKDISDSRRLLADVFALYLKTKNFHWHMSGPHFRDYHLLLDEQADQLFAMTDPIAERVRKWAGPRCGPSARLPATAARPRQRCRVRRAADMLAELREDNKTLRRGCARPTTSARNIATSPRASLIEVWIDETERRTWFLFEATRPRN